MKLSASTTIAALLVCCGLFTATSAATASLRRGATATTASSVSPFDASLEQDNTLEPLQDNDVDFELWDDADMNSKLIPLEAQRQLKTNGESIMCSDPVAVDFATAGNGYVLKKGTYVRDQWRDPYGMRIRVETRDRQEGRARILDSADPGMARQLGSPNNACRPNKGPGSGTGGKPGAKGENCKEQGNVLIIQDPAEKEDIKDAGGRIAFRFEKPMDVPSISLMDINTSTARVKVHMADGTATIIRVPRRGNNSYQRVPIGLSGVTRIYVYLKDSGAVSDLELCSPYKVYPTCEKVRCLPEETVIEEDFEDKELIGWTNGKLDFDPGFTNFLGRYISTDLDPTKTYTVPKDADYITLSFDFYEIDSWNQQNVGPDCLYVFIDGHRLFLGIYDSVRDEGVRTGSTDKDLTWKTRSLGPPRHIGFGNAGKDTFQDQIHRVTITIPKTFFSDDGEIQVRLQAIVSAEWVEDESAGYDNFKIVAFRTCGCQPQVLLYKENFEDKEAPGWTDARLDFDPGFTNFLGRYVFYNDNAPTRTFKVPKHMEYATLSFDFYEIDSWRAPDCLFVVLDGEKIFLGIFDSDVDEGMKSGRSAGGIRWKRTSKAPPAPIGFQNFNTTVEDDTDHDQIHHITLRIPRTFFEADGEFELKLEPILDGKTVEDGSAGFDNFELTANRECPRKCEPEEILSEEDFEDKVLEGWTNGELDYDPGFTNFLGRYTGNSTDPFKTYQVPKDVDYVQLTFDFYEIDSWDEANVGPDCLYVFIDGERLFLGIFDSERDEGLTTGASENQIVWKVESTGPPANIGFNNKNAADYDQIHQVTLIIPKYFYEVDGQFTIRLNSVLSGTTMDDETSGFDNFVLTAFRECRKKRSKRKAKITKTLSGLVQPYPTYTGPLDPTGQVTLRFNDDGSHLLKLNVKDIEADCEGCGVHVHTGRSCQLPDTVGPHYWDPFKYPDDPWNTEGFYNSDSAGSSLSGFVIDSGHGFEANNDRTVVLHAANGTRLACAELAFDPRATARGMVAEMERYPGYRGPVKISGEVYVDFFKDDTLEMTSFLEGLEAECVECGIHIHAGTTCFDPDLVGGHYWDQAVLGKDDPWNAEDGAYYTTDVYGTATRGFFLYSGFDYEENLGHAVVVHAKDGTRVGCGVLKAI